MGSAYEPVPPAQLERRVRPRPKEPQWMGLQETVVVAPTALWKSTIMETSNQSARRRTSNATWVGNLQFPSRV